MRQIPLPLFGVAHGLQVLFDLLHLLILPGRDLQPVDGLQQINLFVQRFL
jgi:hypothetical protein